MERCAILEQRLENFSLKGQIVNVGGFQAK